MPLFPRSARALVLGCAPLVFAPAAAAQAPALSTYTDDSVAYRIDLPRQAQVQKRGQILLAASGDLTVMVAAVDVVGERELPAHMTEAEARQLFTDMVLSSDSALFMMMRRMGRPHAANQETRDVVREIGTLNGRRAGYLRGILVIDGQEGWFETHFTVHDGVAYMLTFVNGGPREAADESLRARIRESFVFVGEDG